MVKGQVANRAIWPFVFREVCMMTIKNASFPVESETVEWKQSLGEWKEIVETCAAFATSQGGVIFIGVSPKGEGVGVQIGQHSLEELANKIKVNTDPPQFPTIKVEGSEQSTLIKIQIDENPVKPSWAFGRPIKRVGRTNQCLRREEAHRLLEVTTGRSWDSLPCPRFTADDVDKMAVRNYLERAGMKLTTPFKDLIANARLATHAPGYCNAVVLLFGKIPQRIFISADLKCARFKGTEAIDFLDEQTYEGPLLSQLDNALAFVSRNTHQAYKITGKPEREIVPEYPDEAVREAIINALCHRDYTSVATVQVRIFDDRLEVWNPGCLPHDITLKMLYHQHHSHPKNPMIAHAFFRARLIEHWGSGTTRIVGACRSHKIKAEFRMEGGCFIVCLRKQPESRPESRPESGVSVRMLQALVGGTKSRGELASVLGHKGVSGAVKKSVSSLLEQGLMAFTLPNKPQSRLQKYRLTDKGQAVLEGVQ